MSEKPEPLWRRAIRLGYWRGPPTAQEFDKLTNAEISALMTQALNDMAADQKLGWTAEVIERKYH